MKGFFPVVAKGSEGDSSRVKVKRENAETLAKIAKLSAVAFNAQHSDLTAIAGLDPVKGYVNKAAGVVCTSKGNIYAAAPWPENKRSLVLTKMGDISASAGVPNLVVCLDEGCLRQDQGPRRRQVPGLCHRQGLRDRRCCSYWRFAGGGPGGRGLG